MIVSLKSMLSRDILPGAWWIILTEIAKIDFKLPKVSNDQEGRRLVEIFLELSVRLCSNKVAIYVVLRDDGREMEQIKKPSLST